MLKRRLGKSGLDVSAIGLGCMGMSSGFGPPSDKTEMIAVLHKAIEMGYSFFDTARSMVPTPMKIWWAKPCCPLRARS